MDFLDLNFLSLPAASTGSDDDESEKRNGLSASNYNDIDPAGLPPWCLNTLPDPDQHPLVRLHNEIVHFSKVSAALAARSIRPASSCWTMLRSNALPARPAD